MYINIQSNIIIVYKNTYNIFAYTYTQINVVKLYNSRNVFCIHES